MHARDGQCATRCGLFFFSFSFSFPISFSSLFFSFFHILVCACRHQRGPLPGDLLIRTNATTTKVIIVHSTHGRIGRLNLSEPAQREKTAPRRRHVTGIPSRRRKYYVRCSVQGPASIFVETAEARATPSRMAQTERHLACVIIDERRQRQGRERQGLETGDFSQGGAGVLHRTRPFVHDDPCCVTW